MIKKDGYLYVKKGPKGWIRVTTLALGSAPHCDVQEPGTEKKITNFSILHFISKFRRDTEKRN